MKTPYVQSVLKALRVLDLLTAPEVGPEGLSLSLLAQSTDQRPNTLHNILRSMVAAGYVEALGNGMYAEGPKCRSLGRRNQIDTWRRHLKPVLDQLAASTGEGIVFFTLVGLERVQVYAKQCDTAIKVANPDPHKHFFNLATTRVLAAWSGAEKRAALVRRWGVPNGFEGMALEKTFVKELESIRNAGFSTYLSQGGQVVNLSVPVVAAGGALYGALGCYAPTFRCPPERREELLGAMRSASESMSRTLESLE